MEVPKEGKLLKLISSYFVIYTDIGKNKTVFNTRHLSILFFTYNEKFLFNVI